MAVYTDLILRNRGGVTPDPREIPETVAREVVKEVEETSLAMSLFKTQIMPARTHRIPVLDSYPTAQWLGGASQQAKDSAFKETSSTSWANVSLIAEEIAVLIPVPDAYVADTGVDLLQEVKPLLAQAFARKIDGAVFFGTNKPTTWPTHIYAGAVAAGNFITLGAGTDVGLDIATVAEQVEVDGFSVNAFATRPGFKWTARKARGSDGQPIYDSLTNQMYGETFQEMKNGAWDTTKAQLITGDFSKAILGIRQDLTFSVSDSGVITDGAGNVTYSAFQQDGKILRAVMRVAFAVANPITPLNETTRYPFSVIRTAGGPAS